MLTRRDLFQMFSAAIGTAVLPEIDIGTSRLDEPIRDFPETMRGTLSLLDDKEFPVWHTGFTLNCAGKGSVTIDSDTFEMAESDFIQFVRFEIPDVMDITTPITSFQFQGGCISIGYPRHGKEDTR